MSPFDAPAPLRNGEMIFRGVAISSFDARALDFFGPLRGAGRGPVGRPPSRISALAGTGRRRTGREFVAGKSGNRLDGMHQRSILRTSTEESTEELFLALPDGPSAISGA